MDPPVVAVVGSRGDTAHRAGRARRRLRQLGGVGRGTWTAVDGIPNAAGSTFASVASRGTGFVAVGGTPRSGQTGHAAAWTSADGRTWTAAGDDPSFDDRLMLAVAGGPSGFMAVGSRCAAGECGNNAAWTSVDGLTWHAATIMAPVEGYEPFTLTVAAGGQGWVAGGLRYGQASDPTPPGVWTTVDGSTWTPGTFADPTDWTQSSGTIAGLVTKGSRIVAVGSVTPPRGTGQRSGSRPMRRPGPARPTVSHSPTV